MDSVLEDIKETTSKLEATMLKCEPIFNNFQRKTYKRLLKNYLSPNTKITTPGFLQVLTLILQGKPVSQARKGVSRKAEYEENTAHLEELEKGSELIDTLPFGDLKQYYYTVLEQGLEDANLLWMKRDRLAFIKKFNGSSLQLKR